MAGHESSTRAILYAFLANFSIAIAKGGAAFYTKSGSMLAESIHSLADCSNQLLLFLGMKRSNREPTPDHPLGFGKVIYFWSFIVAMLLFSVGGIFSIYEGTHKLLHPGKLNKVWLALIILAISIVLESLSLLGALREIRKIKGEKTLLQWLKTSRNAELVVVLGEDVAAILGLTVAFVFVLLSMITGNYIYDAIGSICIGTILITISMFLIIRMKSLLIGRSASPELQELILNELSTGDKIIEVLNVITMQFGPQVVLAAKIKMDTGIDIETSCQAINCLEKKIKERFPEVKWCFIEPDISK